MDCSVGFKYAKNALVAGAHDAPPDVCWLGRGTPVQMPHPPWRLRRLNSRGFGALILVPRGREEGVPH